MTPLGLSYLPVLHIEEARPRRRSETEKNKVDIYLYYDQFVRRVNSIHFYLNPTNS